MNRHRQQGVMLLETLIALLIFALGVLGLVGMQATAMKVTSDSKYRAEAMMHADRLVNQMWADDRSNANLTASYAGSSGAGGQKYMNWLAEIAATGTGLPGADTDGNQPSVAIDASNTVTVTIRWQAPGEPAAHKYVTIATVTE